MEITELKKRAEIFLRNNIRVFIKDCYDNFYFAQIKEIFPDWVFVYNFKGNREGQNTRILWIDIVEINEYRGENLR